MLEAATVRAHGRWRLATPIMLCCLAVAACGSGSAHRRTAPAPGPAPAAAKPEQPVGRLAATVQIHGATAGISSGAGSIWVASDGSQTITRISPVTNTIVAGRIPTHQYATDALAGSTGGVFVDGKMMWLNPKTNVVGAARLAGCGGPLLAGDAAGSVWYLDTNTPTAASDTGCRELARFDSATGAQVGSWPLTSARGASGIAAGDGQVWVLSNDMLSRLNQANGRLAAVRSVSPSTSTLGVSDGVAWWTGPGTSADSPPTMARIRIGSLASLGATPMTGPDPLEQGIGGIVGSMTSGAGRVWVTFADSRRAEVAAYDLRTGRPAGRPLPLPASENATSNPSLTFAFGALWVSGNHEVLRIDPSACCQDISAAPTAQPSAARGGAGRALARRPGCSSFCQQAGPEGGSKSYLCPHGKCAPCPEYGCLRVLSRSAQVSAGAVSVQLSCEIAKPCDGAFLILRPNDLFGPGGAALPQSRWVAGSDFQVPARSTATVPVTLTALGQRLASSPAGYRGSLEILLRNYGPAQLLYSERSLLVHR